MKIEYFCLFRVMCKETYPYMGTFHQVAQSIVRRTLEAEVRGLKPLLGTW